MTNGEEGPAEGGSPTPFRPISVGPPGPGGGKRAEEQSGGGNSKTSGPKRTRSPGSGRNVDRIVGIVVGVVLGLGIIVAFVFYGSGTQIDAPRISTSGQQGTTATGQQGVTPPSGQASP